SVNQAFSIGASGTMTWEPTFTATVSTTATLALSTSAPVATATPKLWCGLGATVSSGGSCVMSVTVPAGPDHYEITTSSAHGLTCAPATFTIKACANTSSPCNTLYTAGGISGNLVLTGTGGVSTPIAIGASGATSAAVNITKVGTVKASLSGM